MQAVAARTSPFAVECAREIDIEEPAAMKVITPAGRSARSAAFLTLIKTPSLPGHPAPQAAARSTTEKDGMPPHESD